MTICMTQMSYLRMENIHIFVQYQRRTVGDLFEVNDHGVPTGGLVPKKYLKNGKTPRISVTSKNNGVIGWYEDVDYTGYRTYENCLSVSFMGLM